MPPISIEKLESEGTDVGTTARESRAPQVSLYLQENADNAYTQSELAKELELQGPHAHSILMSLVKKGSVERKSAPGINQKGKEQDLIYYHWIGGDEPVGEEEPESTE